MDFSRRSRTTSIFLAKIYPRKSTLAIDNEYEVPLEFVSIFQRDLEDTLSPTLDRLRCTLDLGPTKNNYENYFKNLLWWEETAQKSDMENYNMSQVYISRVDSVSSYNLEVPGVAEKRPSLMTGDRIHLIPCGTKNIAYESVISNIKGSTVSITNTDVAFRRNYAVNKKFDVRFEMSRVSSKRMLTAVSRLFTSSQECRVFPENNEIDVSLQNIETFFNSTIKTNEEQKMAVQCIVSGTSGMAPYMVYGPPGTGKTVTIVEGIIQLVLKSSKNKIMVCTDSNMAADHIASKLMEYEEKMENLGITDFLLRANSLSRIWETIPKKLQAVSSTKEAANTSEQGNKTEKNEEKVIINYRVIVATLLYSTKYASDVRYITKRSFKVTHLFIDEASQASEPACLVPITDLLCPDGQLILSGDPQQLGPVCVSRPAKDKGLGLSLMERLIKDYGNLYNDPANGYNYITMLKNNYRSHPDILELPNELFYNNELRPLAQTDPLSITNILDMEGGERAIVFHAANSREKRDHKSPSFYNLEELSILQRYIIILIMVHKVKQDDIGVIAPYAKQVYMIKSWLKQRSYNSVEVGTVETFQGKEKRVMLVTTVRGNSGKTVRRSLGFLADDKRFNVILTRAKAKIIIIGNPRCLKMDTKWQKYIDKCKSLNTYLDEDVDDLTRRFGHASVSRSKNPNRFKHFSYNKRN